MSKKIGIKLADGSFYPILEEGKPEKKTLELTTVKDNQETVQVDLYRSENGTMDDAEYVDSLQVDNLKAHPNGEPTLSFDINLDENDELSAEISDPESGKKSTVEINLINRTEDERKEPANFEIAPETPEENPVSDDDLNQFELPSIDDDSNAPTIEKSTEKSSSGLLAAAEAKKSDDEIPGTAVDSAEPSFDEPEIYEEMAAESAASPESETPPASDLPAAETDFEEPAVEEPAAEDAADNPVAEDKAADDKTFSFDSLDLGKEDVTPEELPDIDFNETVPMENNGSLADEKVVLGSEPVPEAEKETAPEKELDEENFFNLPDFDDDEFASKTGSTTFAAQTAEANSKDSLDKDEIASMDFDSLGDSSSDVSHLRKTSGRGLSFDNLYDKETIAGTAASNNTFEAKKTNKHVVICVICAIICIIATLLVLFIVPSKLNLLNKVNAEKEAESHIVPSVPEQVLPPPEKPQIPEAKENEIVVSPTPQIVPSVPPAPPKEDTDITYKIRWGDTLWDISEAFYRNPWKYSKLANFNRIKNPDYIISGTTIIIPAE